MIKKAFYTYTLLIVCLIFTGCKEYLNFEFERLSSGFFMMLILAVVAIFVFGIGKKNQN
jgi:hypothetical protein